MTRKDYVLIALAIGRASSPGRQPLGIPTAMYKDTLIRELCNSFSIDNPNFDKEKFKEACYKKGG